MTVSPPGAYGLFQAVVLVVVFIDAKRSGIRFRDGLPGQGFGPLGWAAVCAILPVFLVGYVYSRYRRIKCSTPSPN